MTKVANVLLHLCCVLYLLPVDAVQAKENISVYFTPSEDCRQNIIRLIDTSKTIDIAIFSFTDKGISSALERAKNNGAVIRILTDSEQAKFRNSRIRHLLNNQFDIRFNNNKDGQEHNKFAIFDGDTISTGSFNWTYKASYYNSENCIFIYDNPDVIKRYSNRFNYLWSKSIKNFDLKLNRRKK